MTESDARLAEPEALLAQLRRREDADQLVLELLGTNERSIVPRIDAQLDRIPGLTDLGLLQRTVDRARGATADRQSEPPRFASRRRAVSATFAAASEARLSA